MATSSSAGPPSSGSGVTAQQPQAQYLVLAVEATAALGPSWPLLRSEYLDKIARAFYGQDGNVQKDNGATLEMALVVFRGHDSYSGCLLQRSGWTPSLELFQLWLSSIDFSGGGFGEVAVAEGLAEALVMCCPTTQPPSNQACQRHCILVAASNPHRLQTPVPHPPLSTGADAKPDHWWLADAEAVARAFSQCHISLSVVCPRQLPSLKNLYSVAKQNPRASDPSNEIAKHTQHLVLISESFLEARNCLRRVTQAPALAAAVSMPPSPTSVKVEQQAAAPLTVQTTQPVPATAVPSVSTGTVPTTSGRQSQIMSNGNIPTSTVKIEHVSTSGPLSYGSPPMANTSMAAVSLPIQSSGATSAMSQEVLRPPLGSDSSTAVQDFKSINTNTLQSHRPVPAASVLNQIRQGAGSAAVSSILSAGSLAVGQAGMGITQPVSQPASLAHGLSGDAGSASLGPVQGNANTSSILPSNAPAGMMQPASMPSGLPPVASTVGMAQSLQAANPLVVGGQSVQGAGLGMPHSSIAAPSNSVGSAPNAGVLLPMSQPGQNPATGNAGVSHLVSNGVATTPPQQPANTKYTKLWQGTLAGQRHGKPVPICSLEGYRQISSPETLAADWPLTMQIVRLIPQDYMSNREYQGKAELLVFRPLNQHGFLQQLADKKLCAVIQLPSQTLLLASADKPQRMIGMLFPGDTVVFKPQGQNPQPGAPNFSHGGFPPTAQQSKPPQMMPGGSQMPMAGSGGTQIPGQSYLL
ncbi:mediator of RNA polymerase II transcription subunit 25 isoform X1 [Selaginella moellendorffii]|uniref:mediator of RNA polymerase II transcription subunit 25 isoform X1 n=1 Tax=Selaginella moellendorffii TaxID=88036 RepID=UPI000D1CB20C|nr:mediator of RNA polymerase II transcription subunit 25 isoform X1 [Selaginella moellendorffii]|eukprot:XP_024529749.1 mediator of RNA polymerase II transcription subunit 25 isoform X1 [Selaginella moellendorffii]